MWRGYSLIINLLLTLRGITATIPDAETTIINLCSCGMEWQECASACPLTCSNYSMSSINDCAETCSEGCGCPEGKVLLDGVCVTTSTCASAVFNNQKTIINNMFFNTILQDVMNVLKARYVLQSYLETVKQLFVRTLQQVHTMCTSSPLYLHA